ncbi:MAG: TonB-dependent receptor [Syntrophobacterales bacterium]|nr:TonB-dependent receptor [Syntrophobacterales bacterium]
MMNYLLSSFIIMALFVLPSFAWEKAKEEVLEEIVVTATRTKKEVTLSPASTAVVTRQEMEMKDVKTIDQAVSDISGIMVRRGKGLMDTLSSIALRGIPEQKRTLILMDGMTFNNPYTGGVKFGGFYPEDLERVEVVKGPFSSLYGGYAMGGVVNFITRMPEKREIILKAGYGSGFERGDAMDDLTRIYFSYGDKIGDNLSFLVSYGRQSTEGYPTDLNVTSRVPPSGITGWKETKDRYGKTAYLVGDKGDNTWWDDGITIRTQYRFSSDTKLGFTFMRNRYGYDYDEPHTYLVDSSGRPVYSYSGLSESSFLPGGGARSQNSYGMNLETVLFHDVATKLNITYLDTEKDWYVQTLSGATWSRGGPGYVSSTPQEAVNSELQFSLPLGQFFTDLPILSGQILTFGGSFRWGSASTEEKTLNDWRDEDSTTNLRYNSKGRSKMWAVFVQDEIPIMKNLIAYVGFRYDWWETYDGYVLDIDTTKWQPKPGYPKEYNSKSDSAISPKFALVYKPFETTTLRGSVGKAFRAPTVYELYRTWTSASGITYAGNPDLAPEITVSWDIGIEQKLWEGAKVSLTYFENHMEDLIYRQTVTPTYQRLSNVGKAESRGIECEVEQRINKWLKFYGNFTYVDSEVKENLAKPETEGKRLTYVPRWMGNIGVQFERAPFKASIVGRYVGKWHTDDTNADKYSGVYGSYDSHWVTDLKISYDITKWSTLSFVIDNLFDEDYYQYYKAPGRSWFAEVSIKF